MYSILVQLLLLRSLFLLAASCSESPATFEHYDSLELTPQSLANFAAGLKNGSGGWPTTKLQECLENDFTGFQELCLTYIIGSIAVFGRADEDALGVIRELYVVEKGSSLLNLLRELAIKNDRDTAVRFITNSIGLNAVYDLLSDLIVELIKANWSVMEALTMEILVALKLDKARRDKYSWFVRQLDVERQYEMVRTGFISLKMLSRMYTSETPKPELREIFAMTRCSRHSSPQLRSCIAEMVPQFRQFLADSSVTSIAIPCPSHIPKLHDDAWIRIFTFLDFETLAFALPLVCNTWRKLGSKALTNSAIAHNVYLQDVCYFGLRNKHTIAPWKSILLNTEIALRYLGCCIAAGALSEVRQSYGLQMMAMKYLEAVASGKVPLPAIQSYVSPYDFFLELFEMIYNFGTLFKLPFVMPKFFTDEEYEKATRHLIYEKRWALELPESLIANNMPKLFRIIEEDEELMKKLIAEHFEDFRKPALILILQGQTSNVPEGLGRLVFSQTDLFRRLVEPRLVRPSEYYDFIADSDMFPELIMETYGLGDVLYRLIVSFVLHFKNDPDKINGIVALVAARVHNYDDELLKGVSSEIGQKFSRILEETDKYPLEDVEFFKTIMSRHGLFEEFNL